MKAFHSSCIYGLYSLEDGATGGIRYVGMTRKSVASRRNNHLKNARNGGTGHVSKWIRKCNYNIGVVVLDSEPEDLAEAERFWIKGLRKNGLELTNMTDGGEGLLGHKWTTEQRERVKGVKLSDATKEAIAKSKRGVKLSPEHRAAISEGVSRNWAKRKGEAS